MEALKESDQRVIEAAEGWLGLGSWRQAETELENIEPDSRGHPEVLKVRWHILAAQERWVQAGQVARSICTVAPGDPSGWASLAYAAHKLNNTSEARQVLLTVVDEFPRDYTIRYDLACYTCQLGNLGEAWYWLQKAMALPHSKRLDRMALQDPSLKSLWEKVAKQ